MLIAEDLNFDMAGPANKLLDEHIRAAKRRQRFSLCLFKRCDKLAFLINNSHSTAAATLGCLQDDRITQLRRKLAALCDGRNRIAPAEYRRANLFGDISRVCLVAQLLQRLL